jgi:chromatin remodeling complex protein RSC6
MATTGKKTQVKKVIKNATTKKNVSSTNKQPAAKIEPEPEPEPTIEPEPEPEPEPQPTIEPEPVLASKPVQEYNTKIFSPADKCESIENAFIMKLNNFTAKIAAINKDVKELQGIGKVLEKDFNNVVKAISKQKNKNKNSENRTLSGFAMPSLLSPELYEFLRIEAGTRIPRKDVTKMLNDYIKENNLRNEQDRRKIIPDENLKRIFKCTDDDNVTYFNLQTYMKHHFVKDIKQVNNIQPITFAA